MKSAAAILALILTALAGALPATAAGMEDVKAHPSCAHCGMDREAFSYSRMVVAYEDGREVGTCSLRCAALELSRNPDRKVKSLRVSDHDSRELLEPEKAVWVMGGKERGVMTRTPKWAFATREGAAAFVAAKGGEIVPYGAALAAAREELGGGAKGPAEGGKASGKESGCGCCDRGK